jgi:hypothetical protein
MRRHSCNDSDDVEVDNGKDLGVNIDNELKFSKHIDGQVYKANKELGLIRPSIEFLDAKAMKQLFVAVVRPNLEI